MNATTNLLHGIGYAMHANTVGLVGVAPSRLRCVLRDDARDTGDGCGGGFAAAGRARPAADWRGSAKPRSLRRSAGGRERLRRSPSPRSPGSPSPA